MSLSSALHGLRPVISPSLQLSTLALDMTALLQNQVMCAHCLWQSHALTIPEATVPEALASLSLCVMISASPHGRTGAIRLPAELTLSVIP